MTELRTPTREDPIVPAKSSSDEGSFTGADSPPEAGAQSDILSGETRAAHRNRRAAIRQFLRVRTLQVLLLIAMLLAWQLIVHYGLVGSVLARGPGDVWTAMREAWHEGSLSEGLQATMLATLIAFVLASSAGILIGMGLAFMPRTEQVVNPFLDAFNSMPRIALGPVFIIAFGISMSAKVALAFTIVVFILIYNARAGFRSADPDVLRLSRVMGATRRNLFLKVMLPVAVPSIFAGLRLGLIYSLLGVVTAEIIASRAGLGQLIMQYSGTFRLEGVYGILIILAIVSSLMNTIMQVIENRILRWQAPEER